jgi:hypothetical protein
LVDLTIKQQFGGILDDLHDLNFGGFAFTPTFVDYADNSNTTADANLSIIIITNVALWSLLANQRDF